MASQNLGQVVGNRDVQLVEGTTFEEGAGASQGREIIQGVNVEEVSVGVWIREIIARDVGQGGEALVDVILARVVDDVGSHLLLVSKHPLVVQEGCEVAVDHLGVVPHSDGKPPGSRNPVLNPFVDRVLDVLQQSLLLSLEQSLGCTRLKRSWVRFHFDQKSC